MRLSKNFYDRLDNEVYPYISEDFGSVIELLVRHFEYSVKDLKSLSDLTKDEKKLAPLEVYEEIIVSEN